MPLWVWTFPLLWGMPPTWPGWTQLRPFSLLEQLASSDGLFLSPAKRRNSGGDPVIYFCQWLHQENKDWAQTFPPLTSPESQLSTILVMYWSLWRIATDMAKDTCEHGGRMVPIFTRISATLLSILRMFERSHMLNSFMRALDLFFLSSSAHDFNFHLSSTWLMTRLASPFIDNEFMPYFLARWRPLSSPSYSTELFDSKE